jgi:hypothetical protein
MVMSRSGEHRAMPSELVVAVHTRKEPAVNVTL